MTGWEAENLDEIVSKDNKSSVGLDAKKKKNGDNATLFILESHDG